MAHICVAIVFLLAGSVAAASNATAPPATGRRPAASEGIKVSPVLFNTIDSIVGNAGTNKDAKPAMKLPASTELTAKPAKSKRTGTSSDHVHDGKTKLGPSTSIVEEPMVLNMNAKVPNPVNGTVVARSKPMADRSTNNPTTKKPLADDYPSMHTKAPVLTPKPTSKYALPVKVHTTKPSDDKKRDANRWKKATPEKTKIPSLLDKAPKDKKRQEKRKEPEKRESSPDASKKSQPKPDASKKSQPKPDASEKSQPKPDASKKSQPKPDASKKSQPKPDAKQRSTDDSSGSDRSNDREGPSSKQGAPKKEGDAAPAGSNIDKAQVQSLFGGMTPPKKESDSTGGEVEVTDGEPAAPSNQARSMFSGIAGGLMGGGSGRAKSGMGGGSMGGGGMGLF